MNNSRSLKTYLLHHSAIMLIVGLITFFFGPVSVLGQQPENQSAADECIKCHQKTWDNGLSLDFIHKPFIEKKCQLCHIHDNKLVAKSREFMKDRNVNWLAKRLINTKTHWFTVPIAEFNDIVILEYQVLGNGVTVRDEIVIPPLEEITELVDDKKRPVIENIQIKDLNRGLFLSGKVSWQTDELSTSQVYYGLKKPNIKSQHSFNYTKNHSVQLSELKFKKKYKIKIVSEDIFGNISESKQLVFSTAKAKRKSPTKEKKVKYPEFKTKNKIYWLDGKYIFRIVSNRPVIIALGTPNEVEEKEEDLKADGLIPDNHNLKDALMTNTLVCEPCHGKYTKDKNHPVNVSAKPGMAIPEEYFVLSNGNITCMTCHSAHSSNFEYRLVRQSKRELCIGCHLTKI